MALYCSPEKEATWHKQQTAVMRSDMRVNKIWSKLCSFVRKQVTWQETTSIEDWLQIKKCAESDTGLYIIMLAGMEEEPVTDVAERSLKLAQWVYDRNTERKVIAFEGGRQVKVLRDTRCEMVTV